MTGTIRLGDFVKQRSWWYRKLMCSAMVHNPDPEYFREPGRYEHICVYCGNIKRFEVRTVICRAKL